MSHAIYYKLTKEQLLNKFPLNYNFDLSYISEIIEELKQDITTFVAKCNYDPTDQINVPRTILKQRLKVLYKYIYDKTILEHIKQLEEPDSDSEIWISGGNLDIYNFTEDESDIYNYTIKYLLQYGYYPEPDILDNPEKHDDYINTIEEYIDGFIESAESFIERNIFNTLNEAIKNGENLQKDSDY